MSQRDPRRRETDAAPDHDLVSVVVPARDEQEHLAGCLDSILAQEAEGLEVLVVDNGSSDRTPEIIRDYATRDPRVRPLRQPVPSIPRTLNLALRMARGRWFVRVDAHAEIPADYVRRAVELLRTGRYGAVGGRKEGTGATPSGHAIAAALGSRFGVGDSRYHYVTEPGPADHVPYGAYPTALLRELGGWDERLEVNEDFELDQRLGRAGYELHLDPALRVIWHSRQTIRDLFRQYRRYGRGKAAVARLHPGTLRARHLVPPAFVAGIAALPAVAAWRPRVAGAGVAPYLAALAVASALTARRVPGRGKLFVPAAFVTMHVAWGLGFWEGLVAGRRP